MPKDREEDCRPPDKAAVLRHGRWFSNLPADFQAHLLQAGVEKRLTAGERLFSRGDPPCGIYGVIEGAIRITGIAESGKEALLILSEPPSWFGEIAVFDGLERTHDAIAEQDALLFRVPQEALLAILKHHPEWWQELGLLVTGKLRLALIALEDVATSPLAVRLARRLLLMAGAYGERTGHTKRVVEARQDQLAMMLSTSRQTTNQLLKELEANNVIRLSYGEVEILDIEALRTAARF